ncbi:hypothetical protein [Roseobacter weihaiensis]|uniref:hypothetical protein n=1 Tax=Roseobacter weihaiensis TaxID=2763262 RepID=UPI001D0BD211|nr:hypothetical protein [Roseobacter sp. H9]
MNRSLDRYVEIQEAFLDYAARVREMNDDEADSFVQEKKTAFNAIGPEVMGVPHNWWSLNIEQMKSGTFNACLGAPDRRRQIHESA